MDAQQADVVLGEGDAMEFIAPEETLALDLAATPRALLPGYFASDEYRRLALR